MLVLSIFSGILSTIQAFFSIGIYFFYFISNNNCRLLTINIVSFIFFYHRESKPPCCLHYEKSSPVNIVSRKKKLVLLTKFRRKYLRQASIDFDFCNIRCLQGTRIDTSWLLIYFTILWAFYLFVKHYPMTDRLIVIREYNLDQFTHKQIKVRWLLCKFVSDLVQVIHQ
jgi:hypothetical protein